MKNYIPSLRFMILSKLKHKSFIYEFYFKNKKTLDIGCGEGDFLKNDKDLITGIDPNARVIESLLEQGFKALRGSASELPFSDNEFEALHCHNVIEHLNIDTAYHLLQESQRVLKQGGLLVLSSEVVTNKFWNTFGHVRPYPPEAVIKLLRDESREEFEGIKGFEVAGMFYIGDYYTNKLLYLISFALGYWTKLFRREYFLILKKK